MPWPAPLSAWLLAPELSCACSRPRSAGRVPDAARPGALGAACASPGHCALGGPPAVEVFLPIRVGTRGLGRVSGGVHTSCLGRYTDRSAALDPQPRAPWGICTHRGLGDSRLPAAAAQLRAHRRPSACVGHGPPWPADPSGQCRALWLAFVDPGTLSNERLPPSTWHCSAGAARVSARRNASWAVHATAGLCATRSEPANLRPCTHWAAVATSIPCHRGTIAAFGR